MAESQSKQTKTRQKSIKIVSELIDNDLILKLACDNCYRDFVYSGNIAHSCDNSYLLVASHKSSRNYVSVKKVPIYYEKGMLCKSKTSGQDCPHGDRCTYPHSEDEKIVWDILKQNGWKLDALISDLSTTDVYLRCQMETILASLTVLFVCKKCFDKGSYKTFNRPKRQSMCKGNHKWVEQNITTVVDMGHDNNVTYLEVTSTMNMEETDIPDTKKRSINILKIVITAGFTFQHLEDISRSIKQRYKSVHLTAGKCQNKAKYSKKYSLHQYNGEEKRYTTNASVEDKIIFDDDFTDVLNSEDLFTSEIEEHYKQVYLKRKQTEDLYYEILPHQDLRKLLVDCQNYKLCSISLDGRQRATCTLLNERGDDIEVKGRQNCGPTCEGDHVVIKLRRPQTSTADGERDAKKESIFGEVVGIMKQNTNRKACSFLCTVDEYFSHLMIPMCGTLPKIHVRHFEIKHFKDELKNTMVCVYKKEGDNFIKQKVIRINCKDKQDKLFVVKYEKWEPTRMYPFGYVVKVIENGHDLLSGQRALNLMYQVPIDYKGEIDHNCELHYSSGIPSRLFKDRENLDDLLVFSIDPAQSEDIDDALSIQTVRTGNRGNNVYKVGIHIADVSAFLDEDCKIDQIAFRRKISYYPVIGQPVHMLPSKLSCDLCSLKMNQSRLALSLFLEINSQGTIMSKPEFVRTIIKNRRKLSYVNAEDLIMEKVKDEEIGSSLILLHSLSKKLKERRCGGSSIYTELPCIYNDDEYAPEAHSLIEEFMILANTCVARYLSEKIPDHTLLRSQEPPSLERLKEWQKNYNSITENSLYFRKYQQFLKRVPIQELNDKELNDNLLSSMPVLKSSFSMLEQAASRNHIKPIINIISTERLHPVLASSISGWHQIQSKAKVGTQENPHFGLLKERYTWFTSPIRRYSDIIVHRLILATLAKKKAPEMPYSKEELSNFCCGFNTILKKSKQYHKDVKLLKTACGLKENPLFMPAFIDKYDDEGIEFMFPYLQLMSKRKRQIDYNMCGVSSKPGIPDRKERICKPYPVEDHYRLTWKRRIYDVHAKKEYCRSVQMARSNFVIYLHPRMHIEDISIRNWKVLLNLLTKKTHNDLSATTLQMIDASKGLRCNIHSSAIFTFKEQGPYIHEYDEYEDEAIYWETKKKLEKARTEKEAFKIRRDAAARKKAMKEQRIIKRKEAENKDKIRREKEMEQEMRYLEDITSEMRNSGPIIKHHVTMSLEIDKGYVSQVQLGAKMSNGILEPTLNLISISKSLDFCIEHAKDPVKCFADRAMLSCKKKYTGVEDYQQTWLPILAMEAVTNATQEGDPIIIHNVPVAMNTLNGKYFGSFELSESFCNHRHIKFIQNTKEQEEDSQDYLCLRCPLPSSHFMLPERTKNSPLAEHFNWRNMWVAHAKALHVTHTAEKNIKVEFDVKQHNAEPPKETHIGQEKLYTVEYIIKTLPDRRMENAVRNLHKASDFCKKIIFGQPIDMENDNMTAHLPLDLDITLVQTDRELPRNNNNQNEAIRMALSNKLSIIQGPPGTGKTLTAVKLMFWFTYINHQVGGGGRRQVMYCGPSNSAVDVAVKQLTYRLGKKCPKIVRVYSEMLENQVFPIPRDTVVSNVRGRKYQLIGKKEQEFTALHYLIRKPSNSFSAKIKAYDKMFKTMPAEDIKDEEIEKYQKLITDAAVEELPKYDVVLCTCTVSASPRIKRSTNIYQCLIDECGMCMEPETLVPLVTLDPKQIVLIGDHKQLRPIVKNQTAKDLGLDISMFERQIQLRESQTIMLNTQYRMHAKICAFPSKHFYGNQLYTVQTTYNDGVPDSAWPNRRAPVVFCHVKGDEKSLSVATDEGNEQSKWNEAEAKIAMRIYTTFVNEYGVEQSDICILSQYKAQCKAIEKLLTESNFEKPNVSTVVASQGDEWNYVILSTVRSLDEYEIDKRPTTGWLKRNLGFIVDHNQINVAITRARRGLMIIGNKSLLRCDKNIISRKHNYKIPQNQMDDTLNKEPESGLWYELLKFYKELSPCCVVEADDFPMRPDELERMQHQLEKTRQRDMDDHYVSQSKKRARPRDRQLHFKPEEMKMPKRLQESVKRKY